MKNQSDNISWTEHFSGLSSALDSTPACLKLINSNAELLRMNRAGLDFIEADDFESVHKANVYDLISPEFREEFKAFNERICSGEKGSMVFEQIGLKGTKRWMETYAAPLTRDCGEVIHIAITNDITEKIERENEIKQQEQKLLEAARLTGLGEFAGGIAHEINNPLAIILAKSELLNEHLSNEEFDKKYVKSSLTTIQDTVLRISEIITTLKTFSRDPKNDVFKPESLNEIIDEAIKLCGERFMLNNVTIKNNLKDSVTIKCQKVAIAQAIMNLLNNSFDSIDKSKGGKISLESEEVDGSLLVSVIDNGRGVPQEIRQSLMNPFFTTKAPGEGTGLGLTIVNNVMTRHNGRVHYDEHHPNTKFTLEFPIV